MSLVEADRVLGAPSMDYFKATKGLSKNYLIILRWISFRSQGTEMGAYSLYVTISATQKTEG